MPKISLEDSKRLRDKNELRQPLINREIAEKQLREFEERVAKERRALQAQADIAAKEVAKYWRDRGARG
jgi:hypothetical protein